jgi:hypothetical protein
VFCLWQVRHIKANNTEKSSRRSDDSDSDDDARKKRSKKSYSAKSSDKKKPDRKHDESRKGMRLLMAKDVEEQEDQFLIDSGASSHMAKTRNIMINVKKIPERKIVTAKNDVLVCNQSGDIDVRLHDPEGDMITTARLRKVLHVPGLHANLLSCAAPTKSRVTFTGDGCRLVD